MTKRFLWLLLALSGCGVDGIHSARPVTRAKFDPVSKTFSIEDSKDNDILVKGLEVEGRGKVEEISIRNNASDVRRANVEQMAGLAAQATANWQGAERTVGAFANLAREIMPYVPPIVAARALGNLKAATSFNTPWGGGSVGGVPEGAIDGLINIAGSKDGAPMKAFDAEYDAAIRIEDPQQRLDAVVKAAEKLRAR